MDTSDIKVTENTTLTTSEKQQEVSNDSNSHSSSENQSKAQLVQSEFSRYPISIDSNKVFGLQESADYFGGLESRNAQDKAAKPETRRASLPTKKSTNESTMQKPPATSTGVPSTTKSSRGMRVLGLEDDQYHIRWSFGYKAEANLHHDLPIFTGMKAVDLEHPKYSVNPKRKVKHIPVFHDKSTDFFQKMIELYLLSSNIHYVHFAFTVFPDPSDTEKDLVKLTHADELKARRLLKRIESMKTLLLDTITGSAKKANYVLKNLYLAHSYIHKEKFEVADLHVTAAERVLKIEKPKVKVPLQNQTPIKTPEESRPTTSVKPRPSEAGRIASFRPEIPSLDSNYLLETKGYSSGKSQVQIINAKDEPAPIKPQTPSVPKGVMIFGEIPRPESKSYRPKYTRMSDQIKSQKNSQNVGKMVVAGRKGSVYFSMPPIKVGAATGAAKISPSLQTVPYEFIWKYGGNEVILTGTFDQWQKSIVMKVDKKDPQTFRATLMLDSSQKWSFKYVVDGIWRCALEFPTETDPNGNVNNVVYPIKDPSQAPQANREAASVTRV